MSETEKQAADHPNALQKLLKLAAYPLTILSGAYTGHAIVRTTSYRNLRNAGAFKQHQEERAAIAQQLFPAEGETKDIVKELETLDKKHWKYADTRLEEMGYTSMGKRLKTMHRTQKLEAALLAFTAAGISLGVCLTLADNKSLENLFDKNGQETQKA